MANIMEIEFKCMISKKDYDVIAKHYHNQGKTMIQTNYYFDTKEGTLRKHKYSLRVRELNQTYELTLKVPRKIGRLEMNFMISKEQFEAMRNQKIPVFNIKEQLQQINITELDLYYITSLTTHRQEILINEGTLCIDKSIYSDIVDYEVELEVCDSKQGEKDFKDLLARFNIEYIPSKKGKMNRAIQARLGK